MTASTNAVAVGIMPLAPRLAEGPPLAERALSEIEAIFFDAAQRKTFIDDADRLAFRYRWLGQYLELAPEWVRIAVDPGSDRVIGYLVASLTDPARLAWFGEVPAVGLFADLSATTPAHLHINVAAHARGRGVGAGLIEALVADLRQAGVSGIHGGIHVVTDTASRNVGFYRGLGFIEAARRPLGARELMFLIRNIQNERNPF